MEKFLIHQKALSTLKYKSQRAKSFLAVALHRIHPVGSEENKSLRQMNTFRWGVMKWSSGPSRYISLKRKIIDAGPGSNLQNAHSIHQKRTTRLLRSMRSIVDIYLAVSCHIFNQLLHVAHTVTHHLKAKQWHNHCKPGKPRQKIIYLYKITFYTG